MSKLGESVHIAQITQKAEVKIKDAAISILTAKNIYITQQAINEEIRNILTGWETIAVSAKRSRKIH